MKKLWGVFLCLVGGSAVQTAQPSVRVITYPNPPGRETLERLNLDAAWLTRIKLASSADGIFSLQIIPTRTTPQLVVQTYAGAVVLVDAETGDVLWRTVLPKPLVQPVGYNQRSIFVVRGDVAYVLNRANGLHRVYQQGPREPLPSYGYRLPAPPSAAPTADEGGVFFAMGRRVMGYGIPDFEAAEAAKKKGDNLATQEKDQRL